MPSWKGAKRIGWARGRWERRVPERGRIEQGRAKGVRGSLAKERLLSRKSGPRIKLEYLPLRPERTERPVGEWVAWEARDQNLVDAQYNLGVMYDKGQGVTQDYIAPGALKFD